jgi:hypothetical protein
LIGETEGHTTLVNPIHPSFSSCLQPAQPRSSSSHSCSPPPPTQAVLSLLRKDPTVLYVLNTKTEEIGPHVFRFYAEVSSGTESPETVIKAGLLVQGRIEVVFCALSLLGPSASRRLALLPDLSPPPSFSSVQVAWDGEKLAERYLQRVGREGLRQRLQLALKEEDPKAMDAVLKVGWQEGCWCGGKRLGWE